MNIAKTALIATIGMAPISASAMTANIVHTAEVDAIATANFANSSNFIASRSINAGEIVTISYSLDLTQIGTPTTPSSTSI